uniref:Uncharacterized protein n=1 Tax=Alexandrium catenella TaxID=2925 RepID=A0A7S1PN18_ALECA|mmetsp:Transcript_103322/g.274847  ORF Transcript_103322/g.274847 Transcript_103322/m.274847 type:complete len:169 (+) Transcript_103322:73-579(+)
MPPSALLDMLLIGPPKVGKTKLLEQFVLSHDSKAELAEFELRREMIMGHHALRGSGAKEVMNVLDCSGVDDAWPYVEEWFAHARYCILVYNVADKGSLSYARRVFENGRASGAELILYGNTYEMQKPNARISRDVVVDCIMAAKDLAARNSCVSMEGQDLRLLVESLL